MNMDGSGESVENGMVTTVHWITGKGTERSIEDSESGEH
jgi:hypothetical protein